MKLRKYLSSIKRYDANDVLSLMGLRKRSSGDWLFPLMVGVGAGMAIGAGLAAMFTPYKGEEARRRLKQGAADAQRVLNEKMGQLSDKVGMLTEKIGIAEPTTRAIGGGNVSTSRAVQSRY